MKFSRTIWASLVVLVLTAAWTQCGAASRLKVGSCQISDAEHTAAQYTTIQAAVNAASAGSEILVCPGTYPEQVEITKPLTLAGSVSANSSAAVVVPPQTGLIVPQGGFTSTAPQIFVHDTPGPVIVSNLTVDGSNSQIASCTNPTFVEGIYFLDASGKIQNVVAHNQAVFVGGTDCQDGLGLRVTSSSGTADVTLENNVVSQYDWAIFASFPQAKVTIRNNSLLGRPGSAGIVLFDDVNATVTENTVTGNSDATLFGSGIDVVGVNKAVIQDNHLAYNGYGITFYTFQGDPNSDGGTVTGNQVFGSDADGIAICGDENLVNENVIAGSAESGVNLVTGPNFGAQCTSNNNQVRKNTVNGACAGILIDPASSENIVQDNSVLNAINLQLVSTSCLTPLAANSIPATLTKPRRALPLILPLSH